LVEQGIIDVLHSPSSEILADSRTKELLKEPFDGSRLKLDKRAHADPVEEITGTCRKDHVSDKRHDKYSVY